jgi:hypothetical protein
MGWFPLISPLNSICHPDRRAPFAPAQTANAVEGSLPGMGIAARKTPVLSPHLPKLPETKRLASPSNYKGSLVDLGQ